jgi:hypothetical protein
MKKYAAKTAAVFYLLWGIIHILGGISMIMASSVGNATFIEMMTGTAQPDSVTQQVLGVVTTNRVFAYHSFNIIWIGFFCSVIAITMNWKNSRLGLWFNLALVGFTDLGLLLFMVVPGVMTLAHASPGLLLFGLALIFSLLAIRQNRTVTA